MGENWTVIPAIFLYDERAKIIVYARVNDAQTPRSVGSKTDPYAVFEKMLGRDHPPDDWRLWCRPANKTDPIRNDIPQQVTNMNPTARICTAERFGRWLSRMWCVYYYFGNFERPAQISFSKRKVDYLIMPFSE